MEVGAYYKILQELTWRFYFRFIKGYKGWFTPCTNCQEIIDRFYSEHPYGMNALCSDVNRNYILGKSILCEECMTEINIMVKNAEEVIFGNSDYEPLIETSRTWLDNDDEVHDVTKEEYEKERPYKYL